MDTNEGKTASETTTEPQLPRLEARPADSSDIEFAKTKLAKEEPLQDLTERFLSAFVTGGSIFDECGCGRKHVFAHGNEGNFDEGELESYEAAKVGYPDRYFFHDYSSSSSGYISGKFFVMDCQCLQRRFGQQAKAIWDNRHSLIEFFRKENDVREKAVNETKLRLKQLPVELAKDGYD